MSKSNGNRDKKLIQRFLNQHPELNGFYRREELKRSLQKVLSDFRRRCEELSQDGGTNGILKEFGTKARLLSEEYFGEYDKKGNPNRSIVIGFLYETMETIEGSYRDHE